MSNYVQRLNQQKQKLQEKINHEERIIKQQAYLQRSKERKARTRRLIQKGALLEKYFEIDNLSVAETEDFLKQFSGYVKAHKLEKYQKKEKMN